MKKKLLPFIVLIILVVAAGCATLFAPKTQILGITSDPQQANIFVNGFKMGVSPVELNLKADKSYTIEFKKEGYQTITRIVNTKVGAGWVVLDVLGGLFPVIIDAATGSWYQLDQESVNAVLEKQNE